MPSSRLDQQAIGELHEAAINSNLDRESLLAGISRALVYQLENATAPGPQIYRDLHELARIEALTDGTDPLRQWLSNGKQLAGLRLEAGVFERYLRALGTTQLGVTPEQDSADWMVLEDGSTLLDSLVSLARAPNLTDTDGSNPFRRVICVPERPHPVVPISELANRVWASAIQRKRGVEFFPPFSIAGGGHRGVGSLRFAAAPYERFSVATDGSLHYFEYAREAIALRHPIWGPGVGLFWSLNRLVGAILFAQRLYQLQQPRRLNVAIQLGNVNNARIVFDFEPGLDARRVRNVSLNSYALRQPFVTVGGWVLLPTNRRSLAQFAAECGTQIAFLAGVDGLSTAIQTEIETEIIDNAQVELAR